jgi:hypothetical protein
MEAGGAACTSSASPDLCDARVIAAGVHVALRLDEALIRGRWRMTTGGRREPTRWRIGVVALLGVSALGLAACSAGPSSPSVASLSATTTTTTGSGAQALGAQTDQALVSFARCLRVHGVNEPDPTHRAGHSGLTLEVPAPSPGNRAALAACNHFIAKLVAAKEAGARAELAQWLPALTRYAQCMRAHDIAMLDPGPQGQLNLGSVAGITNDFGRYGPQFRSADQACRHLLPGGVRDNGTGP